MDRASRQHGPLPQWTVVVTGVLSVLSAASRLLAQEAGGGAATSGGGGNVTVTQPFPWGGLLLTLVLAGLCLLAICRSSRRN